MKIAHSVKVSVFAKPEEDKEKIKKSLLELFPFDLEDEKIALTETSAESFDERKMIIYTALLEKDRHINHFLKRLISILADDTKQLIIDQAGSRTDPDCNFFLRFRKEPWIEEKKLNLTDKGDCFHIKINLAAFPNKKEKALDIIANLFK